MRAPGGGAPSARRPALAGAGVPGGPPPAPAPRASAGAKPWSESLTLLEEQYEALENIFEQHTRQVGNLLRQHKASLAQHRQALDQQLAGRAPPPGPGPGAHALPGALGWPPQDWKTDSDMDSDGDSVGESAGCMAACCVVPGLEGVLPTEELGRDLLNNGDIYMATRKETSAEPGSLQEKALKVVSHRMWPFVTSAVILLQTWVLGILVNREIHILLGDKPNDPAIKVNVPMVIIISHMLLFMWVIEMVIRVVAGGFEFFVSSGGVGNILEVLLLAFAMLDFFKDVMPHTGSVADFFGFARVFRAFRLMRLLNVCQTFKALHQLRWMLLYIATCLPSFGWALVLLLMFIFIWAILFEDLAIFYLQKHDKSTDIVDGLKDNWKGLNSAMMSLAFSITGGDDYGSIMMPFQMMSPVYGWVYILFVVMVTLCLFNVLVGIFVSDSEDIVTWDRNLVLTNAVKKNDFTEDILRQLFYEIDKNGTGEISLKEMQIALMRPDIRAWFLHLDIDMASNAKTFFELLDDDYSGLVSAQEFVSGCARLKGGAKPLSLESLVIESKKMSETLSRMDAILRTNMR